MKQFIYILWLVAAALPLTAQQRFDVTMTVDSVARQFIVVRPGGPTPPGGYPVVFMFHGTSGDGEKFYNISGWKEKGEEEKIITVFPSSLEYCFLGDDGKPNRTTKWNNGDAQEKKCPGQYLKDDVHFVRQIVDTITKTFPIDRSRIYACGFSNGSIFAHKLAVEMSDVFAAVAGVAGGLHELDSAQPLRPIPVWFAFGTLDDRFISAYSQFGITEFPFNDTALAYMRGTLNRFLGVLGLDSTYTKSETDITLTYTFETPAAPDAAPVFLFSLIDNMYHIFPNGENFPFAAVDPFWAYFSQYSTPLGVHDNPPSNERSVRIYPSPATDFITVEGTGRLTLSLSNTIGEQVFATTTTGGRRIQLPTLATGLYVADVSDGRQHWQSMIVIR